MGHLRGDGRSTLSTPRNTDWLTEGSYHVSNHVVHHPKHIYKATCLMKRKREHKNSQFGKIQGQRKTNYLQGTKNCCVRRKNLFFSLSFSSAENKEFGVAVLSGCIAQVFRLSRSLDTAKVILFVWV